MIMSGTAAANKATAAIRANNLAFISALLGFLFIIMLRRLLIFLTDEFDQVGIEHHALVHSHGEGLGIRLRILDRDFDFKTAVIRAAEAFGNVQSFGMGGPQSSSQVSSLKPPESTTNVSPSHLPTE